MDELLCVVRVNDFNEGKDPLGDYVAMLSAAAGDNDLAGLAPALHGMENDVLLQYAVVAKGGLSGFKNMKSAQFQVVQKVFTERAEVRAIAKTSWRDPDDLPAGNQQPLNECDEARIEIAGFDADGM